MSYITDRLPVTRKGDLDEIHCTRPFRDEAVSTVFANQIPISCLGHHNTVHLRPWGGSCAPHISPIVEASRSVFAEGIPVGRVTDDVGGANCTAVESGSPDVFAS